MKFSGSSQTPDFSLWTPVGCWVSQDTILGAEWGENILGQGTKYYLETSFILRKQKVLIASSRNHNPHLKNPHNLCPTPLFFSYLKREKNCDTVTLITICRTEKNSCQFFVELLTRTCFHTLSCALYCLLPGQDQSQARCFQGAFMLPSILPGSGIGERLIFPPSPWGSQHDPSLDWYSQALFFPLYHLLALLILFSCDFIYIYIWLHM